MKKILSIILIFASLSLLFSCSKKYEPVKSTEEESKVILTIGSGNNKYDIKYELYRSFFLNYKSDFEGNDPNAWEGENKAQSISAINDFIMEKIAYIYATLHFAKSLGINPYSSEFEKEISEYVRIGVEGNNADIVGHGGDYEAYLASLKKMNMNYAVSELLIRYELTLKAISQYYYGVNDPILGVTAGEFEVSDEVVRDYYNSEESVRLIHLYYSDGIKTDEELRQIKSELESLSSSISIGVYIINNSTALESDIFVDGELSGIMVGKYSLDSNYFSEYTDTAFSMDEGDISDIISTKGANSGSYIIHKLEKSEDHLDKHFDTVKKSYLDNLIGKSIDEIKEELLEELSFTDAYTEISHGSISMD